MTSKVFIAAAEEIGDEIAKLVRDGRAAGIAEAVLAHHVYKLFDSVQDAFDAEAFKTIKNLALEYASQETSKPRLEADIRPL